MLTVESLQITKKDTWQDPATPYVGSIRLSDGDNHLEMTMNEETCLAIIRASQSVLQSFAHGGSISLRGEVVPYLPPAIEHKGDGE